jgi:hypothetical protein
MIHSRRELKYAAGKMKPGENLGTSNAEDKQKTFEYLAAAGYERVRKSLIFE